LAPGRVISQALLGRQRHVIIPYTMLWTSKIRVSRQYSSGKCNFCRRRHTWWSFGPVFVSVPVVIERMIGIRWQGTWA